MICVRRSLLFNQSMFGDNPVSQISEDSEIVFVADLFVDDYTGGAELTTTGPDRCMPVQI